MPPDTKIRSGYRVSGPANHSGELHIWFASSLERAKEFAVIMAQATGEEYDICKYEGSVRPAPIPTEFIPSESQPAEQ